MRNFTLALIGALAALAAPMSVQAQVNPELSEYAADIEAARSIMATERKILIMREMALTAEEAEAFWPLYDEYVAARRPLGDQRVKLITDYAANYQTMTDEVAKGLLKDALEYETDVLKLKKKYIKRFQKVLPDIKVVRYFQLENKLDAIIDFDLASQIPLME